MKRKIMLGLSLASTLLFLAGCGSSSSFLKENKGAENLTDKYFVGRIELESSTPIVDCAFTDDGVALIEIVKEIGSDPSDATGTYTVTNNGKILNLKYDGSDILFDITKDEDGNIFLQGGDSKSELTETDKDRMEENVVSRLESRE